MRKAMITMTGWQDKLRWQVATDKMKEGDIIRTYTTIPENPIRPVEGDSHPLGALPLGTTVCQVQYEMQNIKFKPDAHSRLRGGQEKEPGMQLMQKKMLKYCERLVTVL